MLSYFPVGTVPNPNNVIEAVNSYLPYVWKIQKSLEHSKDTKIKLNSPLHFEWSSSICSPIVPEVNRSQTHHVFVFEVTFILVVRALSHYNLARQYIERITAKEKSSGASIPLDDPFLTECFKSSIKELRIGAGVLDFAADKVLNQWRKPPKDGLPEARVKVLKGLSIYFQCQAQRVFLAKVIMSKKYILLPNLFMGLCSKYQLAERLFLSELSILSGVPTTSIDPLFQQECLLMSEMSKVWAFKYTGLTLATKVETGDLGVESVEATFARAVGYMRRCWDSYRSKSIQSLINGSILKDRYGYLLKTDSLTVKQTLGEYENENSTVYYAHVDETECELPTRSQHKFNIVPEEFQMMQVEALSFEQIIRAPPGVDQTDFDAMPKEIQDELLTAHKNKLEEEARKALEAQKAAKKGGFFSRKPKPAAKSTNASSTPASSGNPPAASTGAETPLEAPPGVDKTVFAGLPRDMQVEVINDYNRNNTSRANADKTSNAANKNKSDNNAGFTW